MKTTLLLVLLLAAPASATELTFAMVAGGGLGLHADVGYGNLLSTTLYDYGLVAPDERTLEAFCFTVTNLGTETLTYRTAVGVFDGVSLVADAYASDWQTATASGQVETVIPGGLWLDPSLRYLPYLAPAGDATWQIETLTNQMGIVGMSPMLASERHLVDMDLPYDRDVAMTARITSVPEPSTLLLLGAGLFAMAGRLGRGRAG